MARDSQINVCVVGSCNMDLISYMECFPIAGETVCGDRFEIGCGGKGANQCVMAARLGVNVAMIGRLGNDTFGKMYMDNFKKLNINTDHVHITEGCATGVAPIFVNSAGENSIVIVKGANDSITSNDLDNAAHIIKHSKVLICQLEIEPMITYAALKMAYDNKVITILNPAPAIGKLPCEVLSHCTVLCCNETEAETLTGIKVCGIEGCDSAVSKILSFGVERVVITLGSKGAMYATALLPKPTHVPLKAFVAVDTTGAGDAFVGALATFLSKSTDENDFGKQVHKSCLIAGYSVEKRGTQSSYPSKQELPKELFS